MPILDFILYFCSMIIKNMFHLKKNGVMKKLKVSKNLTYKITLDWTHDFVLSDCIREQIFNLIKLSKRNKRDGLDISYLEDIKYLRGVLYQINLHKHL